tara:strand:+ start:1212 stop:1475 length:264 start_codon:yes stop_codon:yes gene_type:complete
MSFIESMKKITVMEFFFILFFLFFNIGVFFLLGLSYCATTSFTITLSYFLHPNSDPSINGFKFCFIFMLLTSYNLIIIFLLLFNNII